MNLYLALLAAIISALYGGYNLFIKLSSEHINHTLGAAILQNSSLFVGLPILIYLQTQGKFIKVTQSGIILSITAGVLVGLAEILSFYFLEKVDASQGIPIIIGGSVIAGFILGIIVLHEALDSFKIMGILFIVMGILMVSIAPEKLGYQLKAKTSTQSRSQHARVSTDLPIHFIPPYVGSQKLLKIDIGYLNALMRNEPLSLP